MTILQSLQSLDAAPSVQMQQVPPDMYSLEDAAAAADAEADPDQRISRKDQDKMVEKEGEFYEDEFKETDIGVDAGDRFDSDVRCVPRALPFVCGLPSCMLILVRVGCVCSAWCKRRTATSPRAPARPGTSTDRIWACACAHACERGKALRSNSVASVI